MSHYSEAHYYDLLEITPRASATEVEDAYRRQLELLSGESLATYGLFVGEDVVAIRQRIEEAHRVLSDPVRRRAYDLSEFDHSYVSPDARAESPPPAPASLQSGHAADDETDAAVDEEVGAVDETQTSRASAAEADAAAAPAVSAAPAAPLERHSHPPLVELAHFDGASMRTIREQQGITLEQISARTKIAEYYFNYLEEERFSALPPAIYLRSYISQYAESIGIDPQQAVQGYMARYNEAMEG
ncbi:MAG: helix-turn-helix domain-containing protein [Leptospirillia bacterium]